ncbi:4'-phosphopantetheinyl transferase superfamily protein [Streptomyces sp. NPDC052496]|uniref:4'-phosphopantetheinyl transferase family protein n=1 Tax=Streptomyces sp. NPDC052496 TaxID=3154951 RepID=UPI00342DA10C
MIRPVAPHPGLRLAVASVDEALTALRPGDIGPAARTMPAWRAREHLAGRALARTLLTGLGLDPATPVCTRDTGQPHLPGHPHLWLSISHSEETVAAAVADHPVGIDVQVPVPPSAALLRRCCSPATAAALRRLPPAEQARHFAYIWTAQEACSKAAGTGLAGAPWRIRVDVHAREGRWRDYTWRHLTGTASPYPLCLARTSLPADRKETTWPTRTTPPHRSRPRPAQV